MRCTDFFSSKCWIFLDLWSLCSILSSYNTHYSNLNCHCHVENHPSHTYTRTCECISSHSFLVNMLSFSLPLKWSLLINLADFWLSTPCLLAPTRKIKKFFSITGLKQVDWSKDFSQAKLHIVHLFSPPDEVARWYTSSLHICTLCCDNEFSIIHSIWNTVEVVSLTMSIHLPLLAQDMESRMNSARNYESKQLDHITQFPANLKNTWPNTSSLTQKIQQNIRDIISANLLSRRTRRNRSKHRSKSRRWGSKPTLWRNSSWWYHKPNLYDKNKIQCKQQDQSQIRCNSDAFGTTDFFFLFFFSLSLSPLAVANPDIHCKYDEH